MQKRKSYAKLDECYKLPNMLEIQLDSYADFLQLNVPKARRKKEGLEAAFREQAKISPPTVLLFWEQVSPLIPAQLPAPLTSAAP